jgi:acylphosphatase
MVLFEASKRPRFLIHYGMNSESSTTRVRILFSGRVQGVGFRYTVCQLASPLRVAGYVRNLANGDVELVAEGTKQELRSLLDLIRDSQVGQFIRRENLNWSSPTNEFETFRISY